MGDLAKKVYSIYSISFKVCVRVVMCIHGKKGAEGWGRNLDSLQLEFLMMSNGKKISLYFLGLLLG